MTGRPRAAVDGLPQYKPGRSAAQAVAEHGLESAVKLASNESPYGPLPSVRAALADVSGTANRYPDHRCVAVREALAAKLGVGVGHVTVGCGSVGLLQQLFLAYVDPGDEVVYPWRSFEVHPVFSAVAGASAVTVPLVEQAADLDAVAAAVTGRTKLVLLSTPNNPTGTACSTERLRALLRAVGDDVLVVIDEAYREFVVDPAVADPVAELLPGHDNALVLRTFSKAYGLAGLRVGYAVGDPTVIGTLDKVLMPFHVSGLAQAAAIASLLPEAEAELAERVAETVAERGRVSAALAEAGWEFTPSQANFVWLPVGDAAMPLFARLEAAGVVTRPFEGEGVRVTVGSPAENDRFLEALGSPG
ncbi:MAG TPA: histidinol-phosphate transaminase [Acidimicrobiaceae bacterium]|nr:histidinol-phosphate transaminase [Acidimicrobiaceae bacterium]HCB36723.1 histidinol-phosphate transaminase [Acidimicrobiaceae bacterium]